MRTSRPSAFLFFALLAVWGCAQPVPLPGGKALLCVSREDEKKFLGKLGHSNNISAVVSRSRSGAKLFIQFDNHVDKYGPAVHYKLAIVSSEGINVRDLPGDSFLNDAGEPVCWSTWGPSARTPLCFSNGTVLPTDVHLNGRSDGKFIPLFREHENHWWIACIESPLQEIIAFDWEKEFQLLISCRDYLHVFVRGKPEGKPRKDRWFILKHYEYKFQGNKAQLLKVQDFDYTWSLSDFDPQTGMMFARSWDTMFSHGLLVDTFTGKRKDLGVGSGGGYFLETNVARRFREAVRDP